MHCIFAAIVQMSLQSKLVVQSSTACGQQGNVQTICLISHASSQLR